MRADDVLVAPFCLFWAALYTPCMPCSFLVICALFIYPKKMQMFSCLFLLFGYGCFTDCFYLSSDGETFISADDLRINLWNLEISSQSFNIVDVKPANMEDLTGIVIAYQSSNIQLYDLYLVCLSRSL